MKKSTEKMIFYGVGLLAFWYFVVRPTMAAKAGFLPKSGPGSPGFVPPGYEPGGAE